MAGGYAGQVSLGHAAFFGLGAYSAALLGTRGGCRRGSGCSSAPSLATAFGLRPRLPQQPAARPLLRARDDRVLAGAADRGQPLARLHLGLRGHPRPLPARASGRSASRTSASGSTIVLVLAVLLYLVELYLERSRRGYQLAAVREDEDAALSLGVPARRLKVAAIAASAALTAVCGALWAQYVGFVDPVLRLLGRPLGPLRPGRDPRRHRHAARALPRRRPHHDARDVPARALRRHRRRPRRDLPDHLRRRAHRDDARSRPQGLVPWIGERLRRRPVAGPTP